MERTFRDFALQGGEIAALHDQILQHRLVHAVLITGAPGTGKRTLAGLLSASLFCTSGRDNPCGTCSGCILARSGEHPDLVRIEKGTPIAANIKKGRATIPVDDIREMIRICSRYSYEGGNRVVTITDAEDMTPQAQNSLLKILEEPPGQTFFLLTSSHPEQLLTTVRSRCRTVKLKPWPDQYIREVLVSSGVDPRKASRATRMASGSIGAALKLAADEEYWRTRDEVMNAFFMNSERSEILRISSTWKDRKGDAEALFSILEDAVSSLLKYRIGNAGPDLPEGFPKEWIRFADSAGMERFVFLTDRIAEARKQLEANVNFQAVIEQLLLTFIGEKNVWAV